MSRCSIPLHDWPPARSAALCGILCGSSVLGADRPRACASGSGKRDRRLSHQPRRPRRRPGDPAARTNSPFVRGPPTEKDVRNAIERVTVGATRIEILLSESVVAECRRTLPAHSHSPQSRALVALNLRQRIPYEFGRGADGGHSRHDWSCSMGKCLTFANASARGMRFESLNRDSSASPRTVRLNSTSSASLSILLMFSNITRG